MGGGASKKKYGNDVPSTQPSTTEPPEGITSGTIPPTKDQATPTASVTPSPSNQRGQKSLVSKKPADGEASASKVVGGTWTRPKGPSPDDDRLLENWRNLGKLHQLEGVWCAVPYKVIVVPGEGIGDATSTLSKAQHVIDEIAVEAEMTFSHFVEDSEVSAINKLKADTPHVPSATMRKVLSTAITLNRRTRGAFDPAVLPLTRYYKEASTIHNYSQADEIAAYSNLNMFTLTETSLTKAHDSASLDLCGLAKGWAIDEMTERLKAEGYVATYVDWGGDIKVSGTHPAGRKWAARVVEPPPLEKVGAPIKDDQYLAHIELRDGQSIATSGDYLQTLADGMSHIISPNDKIPVEITGDSCATASVVASSCMLADALATAAMATGGVAKARQLLDTFRGASLKDPVEDYLLYSRWGPRLVRCKASHCESKEHREDRLSRHAPAHVVVVGGGLAGVSAAIEAQKARAKVTILEKENVLGGNSAKATSGINACGTRVQKASGIEDDERYFERDTHVSAVGGKSDTGCVSMLSEQSAEAVHWLIDELGISLTALSQLGGHSRKRTHRVPPRSDGTPVPVGYTIMQHAQEAVNAITEIEVKTQCTVTRLLREEVDGEEEVVGLEYSDKDGATQMLRCDAVVLTTGGFGYDYSAGSLMSEYRPDLCGVPTTNGSFANGDAIRFGKELGANLIDMDKVQLHPTAFIDPKDPGNHTKYLGPEALRGSGGILLDQQGCRFVNELDLRSVVSNKILEHCEPWVNDDGTTYRPWAWCVLNDESQAKFGRPMLSFYKDQVGLFQAATGTKGLASLIGCAEQNIVETLAEYAMACEQKICHRTGKNVFPSKVSETDTNFIVAQITPCIHYCMGGLEIGPMSEVLTTAKGAVGRRKKIRRLFAAGECTGGVHGGNRLGGNSLLECVVFGRLAGERAATIRQPVSTLLDQPDWVPVQLGEIRSTDAKYGQNTKVYRFMLHGSLQKTGLEVGRFISIKGELDGDTLTGYYSPVSRPEDPGVIDILIRTDDKGGPIVQLLSAMRPGASCLMKGMGGVRLSRSFTNRCWMHGGRQINKLSLLCGGTGLAPAVQILRAYMAFLDEVGSVGDASTAGVKIVYAAETTEDLAFVTAINILKARHPSIVSYYLVLNRPPSGWTQGVGFVDLDCIRQRLWFPPADDHLTVMCGPPIFEKIMCDNLSKLGYPPAQYYAFSKDPEPGA